MSPSFLGPTAIYWAAVAPWKGRRKARGGKKTGMLAMIAYPCPHHTVPSI